MIARKRQEGNGNGTRVTLAVLGQKVDDLTADVSSMRAAHAGHVARGEDVLQRLSTAEAGIGQLTTAFATIVDLAKGVAGVESKLTVIMWGVPVVVSIIGVVATLVWWLATK